MTATKKLRKNKALHVDCVKALIEWARKERNFPFFYSIEPCSCEHPLARRYEFVVRERTPHIPRKRHLICRMYVFPDLTIEVTYDNRSRIRKMLNEGEIDEAAIVLPTDSPTDDALDLFWSSIEGMEKPWWLLRIEPSAYSALYEAVAIIEHEDGEFEIPIYVFPSTLHQHARFRDLNATMALRSIGVVVHSNLTDRQIRERLVNRLQLGLTQKTFASELTPAPG